MMILNNALNHKIIQALCWTLIHSLWQGLILAIVTAAVVTSTRRSSPALRYNLLTSLLFLFVGMCCYTFWYEIDQAFLSDRLANVTITGDFYLNDESVAKPLIGFFSNETPWINRFIEFLNTHAHWIVTLWFIIFSIKSVQTTSGILYVNRLRTRGTHEVGEEWNWHLRQLAQKIGMYERIGFIASELVSVPIVIGFLRPMIIVPIGFLANLPANQVEAILLHELAHVKRRDYLVNLLQSFGEAVFFFNPAVLWLSSLIREEREHCCDELAISVLENKTSFVDALVSFQEYNLAHSGQLVAFAGKKNHLLDRIKRIIYNNNNQLNAMEKLFVTISFIAAIGVSVAFSPAQSSPNSNPGMLAGMNVVPEKGAVAQPSGPAEPEHLHLLMPKTPVATDTVIKPASRSMSINDGVSTMDFTKDGKHYKAVVDEGEMVYLKIDGKQIEKGQMDQYKPEIEQMVLEVKQEHEKAEVARQEAAVMRKQADEAHMQANLMRKQAEEIRFQADASRNLNLQSNVNADNLRRNKEDLRRETEKMRYQSEDLRKQADVIRLDAENQRTLALKYRAEADDQRKKADVLRKEAETRRGEYEKMQAEMVTDLKREGIISTTDNLSYKLGKNELIVNDKKQSDALYQKFKNKFLKSSGDEMLYNWGGRTGYSTTGYIYER
jgi:bla regulator protein blaR1